MTMPLELEVIERQLAGVGVGTIVLALQKFGVYRAYLQNVRPVTAKAKFVGRARTLQAMPLREDLMQDTSFAARSRANHRAAVEGMSKGDVLVSAVRGSTRAAVIGDLMLERARILGAAAVITDGCVRDTENFVNGDLPVFAQAINMATFRMEHIAFDLNVPVACGEVFINPGDLLVGDRDGVVVIPPQLAEQVIKASREQEELDAFLRKQLLKGASLDDVAPPTAAVMTAYQSQRGDQQ